MTHRRTAVLVALGAALVGGAAWVLVRALATGAFAGSDPALESVGLLLAVAALLWALWRVADARRPEADDAVVGAAPIVEPSPERTPEDTDLSGLELADSLAAAGERARAERSLDAGLESVRPALQSTLFAVLVQAGHEEAAARQAIAAGSWTDDRTAAAVCADAVDLPSRSLGRRVEAWLFPERVTRRLVRRTVGELAAVAEAELPAVPGQGAPKRVRVVHPRLETLRRDVDGSLRAAADAGRPDREEVDG